MDKCYKVHGFPPGHPKAKSSQTMGDANLASLNLYPSVGTGTTSSLHSLPQSSTEQKMSNDFEHMTKDQLQTMISYFSTKHHASASTSAPVISSVSGTFLNLYHNSYYDMLVSSVLQNR